MRTKEINLYRFNELSQDAKENAMIGTNLSEEYFWEDCAINSLLSWAKEIGLEITDYTSGWYASSFGDIFFNDKHVDYDHRFDLNKDLTGYTMDYTLMIAWNKKRDVQYCIDAFLIECQRDYAYQTSIEYASEFFEANDYEFTEDGKVFNY